LARAVVARGKNIDRSTHAGAEQRGDIVGRTNKCLK
jgi:hypothetical protein